MPKGWPVMSARTLETMMLVEVPTSVTRPPISEAKDIGIRRSEAGVPVLRPSWSATGMKIASAPMFLVKTDRPITAPASAGTCRRGVRK